MAHARTTEGNPTLIPILWLTECGGFAPMSDQKVDALSDLVVERFAGNGTGRIVKGLTPDGVKFLKEHVKELIHDLPPFRSQINIS